uniref:Uncharacterized protein n=1 Tax=Timema genevievae TaxID=629358 RepID=A0A7R9K1I0_TIMGE|nr:unnamed protein product [Timema genevievae]
MNLALLSGPVRFYDNERKASILLKQFQNGTEVKVGEFNGVMEQLDLSRGQPIRWHGRAPPKDRTLQIFEHSHVNITIYSILAAAASAGIVMAITFLSINITFRNQSVQSEISVTSHRSTQQWNMIGSPRSYRETTSPPSLGEKIVHKGLKQREFQEKIMFHVP